MGLTNSYPLLIVSFPTNLEVSISSLRQVTQTRSQCVQTLKMVLPYLDVHSNQEYVVQRIRGKGRVQFIITWIRYPN